MDTPSFQFGPYSFLGALLSILGLASTILTARFTRKFSAAWFCIAAMGGFAASMFSLFLSTGIVLWGGALWPIPDAWTVFCIAAVIVLLYQYPQRETSWEARLAIGFGVVCVLLTFGYSLHYAWMILGAHRFDYFPHPLYSFASPLALLVTLSLTIRRTLCLHRSAVGRWDVGGALFRPHPQAQPARDMTIALIFGLLQGVASALGTSGILVMPLDMFAIGFCLLALTIALVYCSWDYTARQPDLVFKVGGLSLITLLATVGGVGLFIIHRAVLQSEAALLEEVEIARWAVRAGDLSDLPESIEYIVTRPDAERPTQPVQIIYARDPQRSTSPLLDQIRDWQETGLQWRIWSHYYEYYLMAGQPQRPDYRLYFGSHPLNSYYQYVGYTFRAGSTRSDLFPPSVLPTYEVLFDVTTANAPVHQTGMFMTAVMLASVAFILVSFPLFFQARISAPLNRLLLGVTQANAGDLNVFVPISENDEIGFLTQSFNDMIVSIRTQISRRQQKENALQELTNTLEQRIASRTRELAVLYDVSAAASQAQTIPNLLTRSLTQTLHALESDLGAVFLPDETDATCLKRMACLGIDLEAEIIPDSIPATHELVAHLFRERESVLILDIHLDDRILPRLRQLGQRSLLAAPLRADDQVLGILLLIHQAGRVFSAEEVALLSSIADQIGVSIQSSRLRQQTVVLEERQHLAQDLHDSVTQVLYGLVTLAEAGQVRLASGSQAAIQSTFEHIAATARQALNEMRLFVHRLRPSELDQQGLAVALSQRVAAVEGWSGVRIRLLVDDTIRLSSEVELALYQIAQEALNNALRHAHAATITLKLQREANHPAVLLEICDDGGGFSPDQIRRGLGLTSMTERARLIHAAFEVNSRPGEGTQIRVKVG